MFPNMSQIFASFENVPCIKRGNNVRFESFWNNCCISLYKHFIFRHLQKFIFQKILTLLSSGWAFLTCPNVKREVGKRMRHVVTITSFVVQSHHLGFLDMSLILLLHFGAARIRYAYSINL